MLLLLKILKTIESFGPRADGPSHHLAVNPGKVLFLKLTVERHSRRSGIWSQKFQERNRLQVFIIFL